MACARNYGTEYKKCVMRVKRNLKRAMQANAGKKGGVVENLHAERFSVIEYS